LTQVFSRIGVVYEFFKHVPVLLSVV